MRHREKELTTTRSKDPNTEQPQQKLADEKLGNQEQAALRASAIEGNSVNDSCDMLNSND